MTLAMFGLGTTEILIIVVVALIFIGPAKLPELARSLGKGMRELRKVGDEFQREMARAEFEQDYPDGKKPGRPGGGPGHRKNDSEEGHEPHATDVDASSANKAPEPTSAAGVELRAPAGTVSRSEFEDGDESEPLEVSTTKRERLVAPAAIDPSTEDSA